MRVHAVKLGLPLSDEGLVDLLLIQWRTPIEDEEGITPAVLTQSAERKRQVLEGLCAWIVREQRESSRPLFVLAPEISTPVDALDQFEGLLEQVNRPTVVVAGIEYLDPSRYRDLILRSCNPELEAWVQGVDACEKVNAAVILTRGVDGAVGKYVQPKIRPADPERTWRVYGAEHVLLFHHTSHAPGDGLHFCVQICSDFCSQEHVSLLRKEIAEQFGNEDFRLDLTLLLQCNRQQEAPQFRNGANAYFGAPHHRKVRTKDGALLMLNNASRERGRPSRWGSSQFRFPYKSWTQRGGEFTYWLQQVSGEEWQAATFREFGPSIYFVTHKPLYLCDRRPGSGDSEPFVAASCWPLAAAGDCVPSFKPLSAAVHWLEAEWVTAARGLVGSLVDQGVNKQVAEALHNAYLESTSEWMAALDHELAKGTLTTLFVCFRKRSGYPYATAKYPDTEPMKWCENPDTGRAAREMLRLHALLRIGASRSSIPFTAAPLAARHALLEKSVAMAYLWGGGEMRAEKMAADYRNHLPPSDCVSGQRFTIVLMSARNHPDPNELARHVFEEQIDRGQPLAGSGKHLTLGGDVTTGETWKPLFVYSHSIEDALGQADVGLAQGKLSEIVQGMVEHAAGA